MAGIDTLPQLLRLGVRLPPKYINKYRRSYPPEELSYSHLSHLKSAPFTQSYPIDRG